MIDDLDWATPDFHALLRRLAIVLRGARVAVVCALRNADDPMASGLLAELARHGATRLHLEPLSVADVAELLTARGESASPDEASALHRRSEGNPFTLGELLKLPPDRRSGPSARVPASVRSVVQARLAELPAAARTMLTYAAADGETLDIGLLADVRGMARDRLLPLADAAVTARVLVWDAGPDEHSTGRYRFPELPGRWCCPLSRPLPDICCTPRSPMSWPAGAVPTRCGWPAICARRARWPRLRNPAGTAVRRRTKGADAFPHPVTNPTPAAGPVSVARGEVHVRSAQGHR
ncbi:hypothetical protein SAZ11_00740 [Streptomyces sp. FXJ1.4098]|nr:hypothetical protein [Streptomyces sp. FXJ1.4098]